MTGGKNFAGGRLTAHDPVDVVGPSLEGTAHLGHVVVTVVYASHAGHSVRQQAQTLEHGVERPARRGVPRAEQVRTVRQRTVAGQDFEQPDLVAEAAQPKPRRCRRGVAGEEDDLARIGGGALGHAATSRVTAAIRLIGRGVMLSM
ncbi:MAG: hypothetical protein E6Q97_24910 [Desulfurellales bacterium]|nr:MAG: hypothetical protein E6Q97_24910 [Desulfurellales bacterium]